MGLLSSGLMYLKIFLKDLLPYESFDLFITETLIEASLEKKTLFNRFVKNGVRESQTLDLKIS